jgi:hypothetical protein
MLCLRSDIHADLGIRRSARPYCLTDTDQSIELTTIANAITSNSYAQYSTFTLYTLTLYAYTITL